MPQPASTSIPELETDFPDLQSLTVAETRGILRIGNTRVYELVGTGELESYKEGRARRITLRSVRQHRARLLAEAAERCEPEHEATAAPPGRAHKQAA